MAVSAVEIRHNEVAMRPLLGGELILRDALATYARLRWPTNAAKHAAREWGLTLDEAKGLVAGRASQATIDKVLKHRNGGWKVAIPILGATIGQELDGFLAAEQRRLADEREQYERRERRLAEMAGDVRVLFGLGVGRSDEPRVRADRPGSAHRGRVGARPDESPVEPKPFAPRRT